MAIFLAAPAALGQVATGAPPFSSTTSSSFDTVNIANLNAMFAIPVLSKAGKGMPFAQALAYNTSVWAPAIVSGQKVWTLAANWGWGGIAAPNPGYTTVTWQRGSCEDSQGYYYYWGIWTFHDYYDSSGTAHPIGNSSAGLTLSNYIYLGGDCPGDGYPSSATMTLNDGSGYTMVFNAEYYQYAPSVYAPAYVYAPSGNWSVVSPQGTVSTGYVKDPNANSQSVATSPSYTTTYTDTLGLTALTSTPGVLSDTYTYTGPNNSQASYTEKDAVMLVKTNFACSGVTEYGPDAPALLTEIDLPDIATNPNDKYTFTYEPTPGYSGYYTGRLASVTLPTGGTISYSYSGGNNNTGIICADGTTATLTRTTPDGTWTYARTENSSTSWSTTVTDPASNQTAFSFVVAANGNAYETERKVYQGSTTSGKLMETVDTCYNSSSIPCVSTAVTLPISNQTVQVTLPGLSPAKTYTVYNNNGLPTETDEYTYGPTLVRKTLTTYNTALNSSYIYDRPSEIQIYDSGGTLRAQTNYTYDGYGNVTQETRSTGGTPSTISRTFTYGSNGVLTSATDFNTNATTYSNFTCNGTFPQTITTGSLTTTETWDCNGGVLTSVTDPNNQPTSYKYDSFWRLIETDYPDGGKVTTAYPNPNEIDTTTAMTSTSNREDKILLDGLGRVSQTELVTDPDGPTYVETTYDPLGRVASVTNPYRGQSPPPNDTTDYNYDPLNRLTTITRPDSNTVGTSYSANCATTTDEALKVRTVCTDAVGRVTSVTEDPSGLNYTTAYTYNALNDLLSVTQGSQLPCTSGTSAVSRSYTYDLLGRELTACNPESATTTLSYAPGGAVCSGNLSAVCSRTDARNITTTYAYNDPLNRPTGKTYSDSTPPVTFSYDQTSVTIGSWSSGTLTNPKGRLTEAVTTASGSVQTGVVYSYDPMGRPASYWQCSISECAGASIPLMVSNYDLAGDVASWKDPAGFTITNAISGAQRITEVSSSLNSSTQPPVLAQNITYTPWGALSTRTNTCVGTGCTNVLESYYYNNRMQPVSLQLGTSANPSADYCMVYNYYQGVANPTTCTTTPTTATTGNNGNVIGLYDLDGPNNTTMTHTEAYTYDKVNRLATAVATGNATYNLTFSYTQDGSSGNYGNMSCLTNGQTHGLCPNWTFSAATNQISTSGFTYDAAGNLTSDGTHTYTWDAEGRTTTVDGGASANLTYNALGQIAQDKTISTHYDPAGERIWAGSFNIVPWGNVPLVKYGVNVNFVHGNALQSSTYVTDQAGVVKQDQILYPWGQSWKAYVTGTLVDGSFATMEPLVAASGEDTGTTLNRNYSESYGRWLSPDSVRGDVTNPQSLNLYGYVTNNPATLTDPTGLCGCGGGGGFGGFGSGGGGGWGGGGGCGGGGGWGGGGGGGGGHRPPPVIPVPGPPTVSVPGGSFPNPFTTGDQPPSPLFDLVLGLPFPPWPPKSGGGGDNGYAGENDPRGIGCALCKAACHAKYFSALIFCWAGKIWPSTTPKGTSCEQMATQGYNVCIYDCAVGPCGEQLPRLPFM